MPQGLGRNLYATLSVFDNVDYFGRLFGQGVRSARDASTSCCWAPDWRISRAPAGKLSGGMKQKLGCVAR